MKGGLLMGMNVTGHKCKKGVFWVDYYLDHAYWWADERLLQLFEEKGRIITEEEQLSIPIIHDDDVLQSEVQIGINQVQLNQIIRIIEQIMNDSFETNKPEYGYKYSNETHEEFLARWRKILSNLKTFQSEIDWKTEYLAIYTSY
jgi:hypothetical protein